MERVQHAPIEDPGRPVLAMIGGRICMIGSNVIPYLAQPEEPAFSVLRGVAALLCGPINPTMAGCYGTRTLGAPLRRW